MDLNITQDWPELLAFSLLLAGFLISLTIGSVFLTYLLALLFGLMAGHFWHERKRNKKAKYLLIIVGFALGYTAGAYYGNRFITILCFLAGISIALYLHKKKYI